jgi:hypothetical protein
MIKEKTIVQGFSHIRIGEKDKDGRIKIVGDSRWTGPNQVVNEGFQDYICKLLAALAGSKQVSYMELGTGTVPNVTHNALDGATGARKTTSNSVIASKTMQATAAWASGDHPGGSPTLRNVGLFNTSAAGSLLCGNTFSTSAWANNQGVSATYQLRFGTTV